LDVQSWFGLDAGLGLLLKQTAEVLPSQVSHEIDRQTAAECAEAITLPVAEGFSKS